MSGIGGREAAGKLVTVQAELPDDIDGILDAIRKIILLGEVQSIALKNDEPITYQRFVPVGEELRPEESTQSFAELTAYEIIRNVPMDEWEFHVRRNHCTSLVSMFMDMAARGWVVTHLVIAENTKFWRWLGVPMPIMSELKQFLGARIERSKELPSDVFILCGSRTRHATIAEIGLALKGTTYEQRADTKGD
jgi:hypothetical protein